MIIDRDGKKSKFNKQDLVITQYKMNLKVKLPSGKIIIASNTDLNSI